MKKLLRLFILGLLIVLPLFSFSHTAVAQTASESATTASTADWTADTEVTFVGKSAARTRSFLDWTLQTYDWANVLPGKPNALAQAWVGIRNIVYAFLILMVLIGAFIFVVTRGRNLKVKEFIPKFIFVVLLIVFSYSIIQLIYQLTDIIQGFFLRLPNRAIISSKNLLNIAFDYTSFQGFKRIGDEFNESGIITLFLVRATSVTYLAMAGILLIRKIILWFFIILSPIFPLLLLFYPVRNTAKIWIAEFLRWVLYAPLFAVLLSGLVVIWSSSTAAVSGIPLTFGLGGADLTYPTSVNILIGGPGQQIGIANSVNYPGTFSLYVVSLLMLWVVILLPFLLLKIFLDAFKEYPLQEGIYQMFKSTSGLYNRFLPSGGPRVTPPSSSHPTGQARAINYERSSAYRGASEYSEASKPRYTQQDTQILRLIDMAIPSIRDIAKYETQPHLREGLQSTLMGIGKPDTVTSSEDKQHYSYVRTRLEQEKEQGSSVADTVLKAAETLASGEALDSLPAVNQVQSVSIDDYEEVKKTWMENYQKLEPPKGPDGSPLNREEWVKKDVKDVDELINLLSSRDANQRREGMSKASRILPLLLVGGFSQTEVVAYLKSKQEAAKAVISVLKQKATEEFVDVKKKSEEKPKELHFERTADDKKKNNFSSIGDEKEKK